MSKISVGCDPEFFLHHKEHGFISAHDIVPGTKEMPHKLNKGAVQADGTAVEFNIDPASSAEEFSDNIITVLKQIREMVDPELSFKFHPSVRYSPAYFEAIPEKAKELGCTPDYDANKDGAINPKPDNKSTMRTGAGHIHIGWTADADPFSKDHMWDCIQVVQNLDRMYCKLEPIFDTDTDRRRMYGAPGAFRPKTFGVEYRVPSNAWVRYPHLHKAMFNMSAGIVSTMKQGVAVQSPYNPTLQLNAYINNTNIYDVGSPIVWKADEITL